ncbi:MAG: calcium/sodium antiporter [Christensenellales bacterium]
MEIFLSSLYLIIGLVLLVLGGDWFVKSSIQIAKRTKIPQAIIGATIVSIATTLPELIVTILSSANGSFGLAVGNSIGSVIANTGLVAGIALCFLKLKQDSKFMNMKFAAFILICLFLLSVSINQNISWVEGMFLILIAIAFFALNVHDAKKSFGQFGPDEDDTKDMKTWQIALFFILGAAGIAGGAELLVLGGENLARLAGMSETFIGLTIIGIGTSLPELVTTISSIRKKAGSIGIGNIVGANILNIGLLIGLASCISGGQGLFVDKLTMAISIPVAIVLCLVMTIPFMIKKESFRFQGITLISIYVIYFVFLIINAIFGYVA